MPCEKELAIYQGVLRLLEQGANIHALKASDIAAAAGLGKGTLYNYFSSKEEILLSTIRYTMEEHLRHLREAMGQREDFLGKVERAMEYEVSHHGSHHQTLFLLSYFGGKGLPAELEKAGDFFPALQEETAALILETAALGQREGVLGNYSQEEILLAFTGVFSALSFRLCAQKEPPDSLVPLCCRMLVRSLAP